MISNLLKTQLADLPRTLLGHLPTPMEKLSRLSHELGGPNIWIKRDDCTGLALGGNKTRKLEYLLGEALSQGCDTVVTFGAIQSNHARQTAAACAKLGLACHLVLSDQVASDDSRYKSGGNVLLDRLCGATLHFVEAGDRVAIRDILAQLRESANLYVIPGGGSNATGALGYARCALEILEQCAALNFTPTSIVHASSSAGTQAGLLWGLDQLSEIGANTCAVLGINVYHDDPEALTKSIGKILEDLDTRFETRCADNANIQVNHAYRGSGYGQITEETIAAIRLTASLEGLIFDPVYSGKALAALIDQISVGAFADDANVILVHTGGSPALNVYQHSFD
ncbi:MAG: pyridoxal-phosphate dependent enzyme [Pseudomonadales bacterium]|nr:pyridoxal-phosphate dependent enzyme [Pseudomonadales bacterium]